MLRIKILKSIRAAACELFAGCVQTQRGTGTRLNLRFSEGSATSHANGLDGASPFYPNPLPASRYLETHGS